jgi:cytoskeleton protein RodZ
MATFGENLRREREMRGVTLEEIAESTKISTRLLRALEQEHFSELPGGVFTRSFIRAYAGYLGLDAEHVLAEYRQAAQPESDYDLNRLTAATSLASKPTSRASPLPWVVAAILLGGGYATYRYAHRPLESSFPPVAAPAASVTPSSPAPAPSSSQGSPAADGTIKPAGSENAVSPGSQSATQSSTPNSEPAATSGGGNPSAPSASPADDASGTAPTASTDNQQVAPEPKTAPSESAGTNAAATTAPVLGDGDLVLRVATTEDSWLAVAADGKTLMQRTLPPNSVRVFRAKDSFDVTTGNAAGTSLALNGESQKPLGRHGEFRKIHLTRDGVQSPAKPAAVPN